MRYPEDYFSIHYRSDYDIAACTVRHRWEMRMINNMHGSPKRYYYEHASVFEAGADALRYLQEAAIREFEPVLAKHLAEALRREMPEYASWSGEYTAEFDIVPAGVSYEAMEVDSAS